MPEAASASSRGLLTDVGCAEAGWLINHTKGGSRAKANSLLINSASVVVCLSLEGDFPSRLNNQCPIHVSSGKGEGLALANAYSKTYGANSSADSKVEANLRLFCSVGLCAHLLRVGSDFNCCTPAIAPAAGAFSPAICSRRAGCRRIPTVNGVQMFVREAAHKYSITWSKGRSTCPQGH